MCGICGCGEGSNNEHEHHKHDHSPDSHLIQIEQDLLGKNNKFAAINRKYFLQQQILALNLVSSPGSGKTSLLEKTLVALKDQLQIAVIEGDQQTDHDTLRIRATGVPAVQINTGKACHLDAHLIGHAVESLSLKKQSLLFIENVGNLVCPALFDLGEAHKVVVLSVTEGDDKPIKYPDMFHAADLMILNKMDLLPYVDFNVEKCVEYARRINPSIKILEMSASKNQGLEHWYSWLKDRYQLL